jgi:hypothetical protein
MFHVEFGVLKELREWNRTASIRADAATFNEELGLF